MDTSGAELTLVQEVAPWLLHEELRELPITRSRQLLDQLQHGPGRAQCTRGTLFMFPLAFSAATRML